MDLRKPTGSLVPLACLAMLLNACQLTGHTESSVSTAPATFSSLAPLPPTRSPMPASSTPELCPALLAIATLVTPSFVGTSFPPLAPPSFLYVNQNELLEYNYSSKAESTHVADLAELGAILDVIRLGDQVFVLREQGFEQVMLKEGSSELVVYFDPPARFGTLMPLDDGNVIYQLAVDASQAPGGTRTVVGLFQPSSNSARIILSPEQNVTLLGQTADRKGLYLLPRAQDRSITSVLEMSLVSEEITDQLSLAGDDARLSPDGRLILTLSRGSFAAYDLASMPRRVRSIALPEMSGHIRELVWSTKGYVYFSLLAGDFYDYDPDNPPASLGLWRLEYSTGGLCQISGGSKQERQLLSFSPSSEILVTGDLQGNVQIWDLRAEHMTAEVEAPKGELEAHGPDLSGQWVLLRDRTRSITILVDLLAGTDYSVSLPVRATFVDWSTEGQE